MEDAERLLIRIQSPGDPAGFPDRLRPAPFVSPPRTQVAATAAPDDPFGPIPPIRPLEFQAAAVPHANPGACLTPTCFTKSGTRTQGNVNCISKLCKTCCARAVAQAMCAGMGRERCAPHKQPQISRRVSPSPPFNAEQIDGLPVIPFLAHTAARDVTPPPFNQPTQASATPDIDPALQPLLKPAPSQLARTQRLAMPLAPGSAWDQAHSAAEKDKNNLRSLKIQQHEMDERKKRTCIIVIYHTASIFSSVLALFIDDNTGKRTPYTP